jgi:phosphotransferase system IIB component
LLAILGGDANLAGLSVRGSRLLLEVKDPAKVAENDLKAWAPRGLVRTAPARWQIILGPGAQAIAQGPGA